MTRRDPPASTRVVVVTEPQGWRLLDVVSADGDIHVVGHTNAVAEAIELVARWRPDVLVIDLTRPDLSQHLIEQVMANTPTVILVLSGVDSSAPVDALLAGALLAIPKPATWTGEEQRELRRTIRRLRGLPVIRHPRGRRVMTRRDEDAGRSRRHRVVAMAASTGGPAALAEVLSGLDGLRAPVLVVQHLHPDFVGGLVAWMARASALPVTLVRHGDRLEPGHVYIGPGRVHLRLGSDLRAELAASPRTTHRPSADELFQSVADHAGPRGVGVLLTGMGDDGARGLLALRRRGGLTLGQDEATSAVYGMPHAAERLGAVSRVLPLADIAGAILHATAEVPA
jgi:two-component system chemotaxis response regulator CheB